jgi:hypothetical protein
LFVKIASPASKKEANFRHAGFNRAFGLIGVAHQRVQYFGETAGARHVGASRLPKKGGRRIFGVG